MIKWPWSTDYRVDSKEVSSDFVRTAFEAYQVPDIVINDSSYLAMDFQKMRAFVYKYHYPIANYKKEVFDCDNFAVTCWADILNGAMVERFKYDPVFGIATVRNKLTNGIHMLNWAITNQETIVLFEPQEEDPDKKWLGVWPFYDIEKIQI